MAKHNMNLDRQLSNKITRSTSAGNVVSNGRGKDRTLIVTTTTAAAATDNNNNDNNSPTKKIQKQRRKSCIPVVRKINSTMRVLTDDESLHSKYGRNKDPSKKEQHIKWGNITVREYERIVGDNPSCSQGPPVSIGWRYNILVVADIDEYEDTRPKRRTNAEMLLPRSIRQEMLMKEWGVTRPQIASAVRTNIKIKTKRRNTVNNLNESTIRMEEAIEKLARKLKIVLCKQPTSHQVQKLQEDADKAADAIKRIQAQEAILSYSDGTDYNYNEDGSNNNGFKDRPPTEDTTATEDSTDFSACPPPPSSSSRSSSSPTTENNNTQQQQSQSSQQPTYECSQHQMQMIPPTTTTVIATEAVEDFVEEADKASGHSSMSSVILANSSHSRDFNNKDGLRRITKNNVMNSSDPAAYEKNSSCNYSNPKNQESSSSSPSSVTITTTTYEDFTA